jgi:hypothetical protein
MNEETPLLPIIIGTIGILYLGYELETHRNKLRRIFNVFDKQESVIAQLLKTMVESGELKPYVPSSARA